MCLPFYGVRGVGRSVQRAFIVSSSPLATSDHNANEQVLNSVFTTWNESVKSYLSPSCISWRKEANDDGVGSITCQVMCYADIVVRHKGILKSALISVVLMTDIGYTWQPGRLSVTGASQEITHWLRTYTTRSSALIVTQRPLDVPFYKYINHQHWRIVTLWD